MKKLLISFLTVLTILLTACSALSTSTPVESTSNDLPIETQLAVGTLKLTGTDQDISAGQAEELVLYWQVYKELSQSDIAVRAEVDGLIAQIQEAMTADQIQAIADLQITQQDVFSSMQSVAIISSSADSEAISLPSGGNVPAGGPPADGGTPMDGGTPPDMGGVAPSSSADQSAQAGSGLESITQVPSALVDAVIQALQQKISA